MLRVTVVFEHESQKKVAEYLEDQLPPESFMVRHFAVGGEEDIASVASRRHMSWPDIVILTIGGRETTAFMAEFRRRAAATHPCPRPLFVSMTVGLALDRAYLGGFGFRQASDVVLVNRQNDVNRVHALFRELNGAPGEVRACLCPIFSRGRAFLEPVEREAIRRRAVKSLLFAVQTDIPSSVRERTYLAQRLIEYARAHLDRRVIIKPRHQLHERTAHEQRFPYEDIFQRLVGETNMQNVVFSYRDIPDLLPQVDLLVSMSSTAIVEALSWGHRAVSILDLGVRENLGNTYFLGSGLLVTFGALIADEIPLPDTEWLSAELESPDLATVLNELEPFVRTAKEGALPFSPSLFLDRCSESLSTIAPSLAEGSGLLSIGEVVALIEGQDAEASPGEPQKHEFLEEARAKLAAGDWAGALHISTTAISRTPTATEHMRVAAEALRRLGRLDEAVRFLKRARRLRPQDRRLRAEHHWLKRRQWLRRVLGRS